jgi:all-trans-retinol 13,14-reductase
MADGTEYFAKNVISAAGARNTVEKLIPSDMRETEWAKGISGIPSSPPHLWLYLGIEGDIRAAGGTPANQWFMETWDMEVRDWDVRDPNSLAPILYMSFPTLKDPKHDPGPTQRHTAEVVTFVPWKAFECWSDTRRGKRNQEYMDFKKGIQDRMVAQLRKYAPKILDITKFIELSTPLSTVHFTQATHGGIYGLEATPHRFTSPHLKTRTPVKNLFLAGGDVATLGVTGAMVGGVLAAASIEPRVFLKFLA